MINVRYTPTFIRAYNALERELKEEVRDAISLFSDKKNHTKLKVHKLKGVLLGRYSFSVNYRIRIIFRYHDKENVNLLNIGSHDQVYE